MATLTIPDGALERFRDAATKFIHPSNSVGSRLLPLKDEIGLLRSKGASYRVIGELLAQSGIPVSAVTVRRFCRRELSQKPSRDVRRKPPASRDDTSRFTDVTQALPKVVSTDGTHPGSPDQPDPGSSGPRIARIQFATPEDP